MTQPDPLTIPRLTDFDEENLADTPIYDELLREYGGLLIHPMPVTPAQAKRDRKRVNKVQAIVLSGKV